MCRVGVLYKLQLFLIHSSLLFTSELTFYGSAELRGNFVRADYHIGSRILLSRVRSRTHRKNAGVYPPFVPVCTVCTYNVYLYPYYIPFICNIFRVNYLVWVLGHQPNFFFFSFLTRPPDSGEEKKRKENNQRLTNLLRITPLTQAVTCSTTGFQSETNTLYK